MAKHGIRTDSQRRIAGVVVVLAGLAFAATGAFSEAPLTAPLSAVNLNTATRSDLQILPGIGPAIAGRIVADRESRGEYASIDELARVPGVGERTVRGLREFAIVGD